MNASFSDDAASFVTVDPFRCRVWDLNDRIEEYVTAASCQAEIDSFERDGQLVPMVGRPLHGNPDFDIEIICGARRLFVARHLRMRVRVDLRELTDQQAAIAVKTENLLRKETSPYERGLWLAKLLRKGVYRSQDEMARKLHITPTQITRLLKFATLPAVVIGAFRSPHEILESWAVELHGALKDDRRRLVIERSRAIKGDLPHPPAASVYAALIAPRSPSASGASWCAHRIIRSANGTTLLRVGHQRKEVVLRIPNALIDSSIEREVTQAVAAILTRQTAEVATICDRRRPC